MKGIYLFGEDKTRVDLLNVPFFWGETKCLGSFTVPYNVLNYQWLQRAAEDTREMRLAKESVNLLVTYMQKRTETGFWHSRRLTFAKMECANEGIQGCVDYFEDKDLEKLQQRIQASYNKAVSLQSEEFNGAYYKPGGSLGKCFFEVMSMINPEITRNWDAELKKYQKANGTGEEDFSPSWEWPVGLSV